MNTTDLTPFPARPNLEQYKKQAKELVRLTRSGDPEAAGRITKWHPRPHATFALADAQLVIAREHGFESWPKFAKLVTELVRENSPVCIFETAADAVINGDLPALETLLGENPDLARARSARVHRATLLHYVGANGFENYRQRTPKNAVMIARVLLDAGAEVDALADAYGKSTALALVATSIHPLRAGVQIALLELLLEHGADINGAAGGSNIVVAALRNGGGQAAEFLASRGARLDLEAAAGVGRLDLVADLFRNASKAQMEAGFLWACEYGRNDAVDFLLNTVDPATQGDTGQTGLHWAVVGGQLETIQMLLKRGAPLEARNVYGATVLGQALWSAFNGEPGTDYIPIIETLVNASANIEDGLLDWLARQEGSSLLKDRIAEILLRRGAKS
ncbi:MAG: ankyrin repeat domain-containing protein [Bryobacteraceae bacterium]